MAMLRRGGLALGAFVLQVLAACATEYGEAAETSDGGEATAPDAGDATVADVDAPDGPCDLDKPFGEPTSAPFVAINTSGSEVRPYLLPDELTLYFGAVRTIGDATMSKDIYRSARPSRSEPFGPAVRVTGVVNEEGDSEEHAPIVNADDRTIFFSKLKNGTTQVFDIWSALRPTPTSDWKVAAPVGGGINGAGNDVATDFWQGELWFYVDDGAVFRAPKSGTGFGTPVAVPELGKAFDVKLAADGLRVFFDRYDAVAKNDIWTATRASPTAPFTNVERVASLNSLEEDTVGWVSRDGCRAYLHSTRSGNWDLYVATRPR